MLDIKFVREHPEDVKKTIHAKHQEGTKGALVDQVLTLDSEWRALKGKGDDLRAQRNKLSKEIADAFKKKQKPEALLAQAKELPQILEATEAKALALETQLQALLAQLPNTLHKDVPLGKSDKENKEIKQIGKPKKSTFEIKNHAELIEGLNQADFGASAKTSGNGFYYLQNDIALLNQALIHYAIDHMVKAGFTYVETPLMLRKEVIGKVADLNDMNMQIYKIQDEDLYLIGTSEHSLIGRYIDTILSEKALPLKHTSYSMCFRKEIGSHGIDQKGLYRTHQFNKVEMIVVCKPSESMKYFEQLKKITIDIFKGLGIPIRILAICSGDLGDLKHIQVDIEAWSPRKQEYFEVGSCSNLTGSQARKLKIRVDPGTGEKYAPHTLNNTAMATSRALVAILENYQQKDGSIKIPTALHKYMYGKKVIGKPVKTEKKTSKKKK
ncbi:serine--tRNA ligase [Candidatus Pacearchaeota archaeon]|nr:serine--tRNA ligase [Candidatus Pacearchaeota archaeon]